MSWTRAGRGRGALSPLSRGSYTRPRFPQRSPDRRDDEDGRDGQRQEEQTDPPGDRGGDRAAFTPSATNQDPAQQIPGVTEQTDQTAQHVAPTEQVAYTQSPPTGGTHDQYWAACSGVVYDQPVRSENLVHSMEHGAAWIAYNPDQTGGAALDQLAAWVQNQPYTALSPYPGLDQPIAL